jgi:hypothetical protein
MRVESKNCLVSIIWSTSGIHSFLVLPTEVWYNTEFFSASVLPDIERNLCDGKRRKTLRGVFLPLDNALAHNAKGSRKEITRTKTKRVASLAYFIRPRPLL